MILAAPRIRFEKNSGRNLSTDKINQTTWTHFFSFTLYLLQELLQIMSVKLGKEYDLLNLALHDFFSKNRLGMILYD